MIVSRCSMDAEIAYKKGKHVTALALLRRAVFRKGLRVVDTLAKECAACQCLCAVAFIGCSVEGDQRPLRGGL